MIFTDKELGKIKDKETFIKLINHKKYWIKPLSENKSYPLGNIKSHKNYFQALTKYLGKYIPETKFIKFDKKITLIVQKNIEGKRVTTLREINELIKLKQNKKFKKGLKQLLEAKKWVIDLYIYKENFIVAKGRKLYYIDGRMPIFPDEKERRYQISKKRTLKI